MSLSCPIDSDGDFEWYYTAAEEQKPLATKHSRKCCSCKTKISVGDMSLAFHRHRPPIDGWGYLEERIYGDEVPMATWYMCEACGDLYFSLDELGFCCNIDESLAAQIKEYREEEAMHRRAA